jgi:hypothetical protein
MSYYKLDLTWPGYGNTRIYVPPNSWGPDTAMVLHFKTVATVGEAHAIVLANTTGPNYNMHVMSLSNAPGCNVALSYPPVPPVMWAAASQTPYLRIAVGIAKSGYVTVQPNTDYWVTVVNRNGYPGSPSCPYSDCGSGVVFDFNH